MTRLFRLSLLLLGVVVVVLLIRHEGFADVAGMLRRVGWIFLAVAALYTAHVLIRTVALWRAVPGSSVAFRDVLMVRLSGEAVEVLTFTGPIVAEPAQAWLLTRRGLSVAAAVAAVATEYLVYSMVSALLAIAGLWWLLTRHAVPSALESALAVAWVALTAFVGAFAFASVRGVGLIAPILRGLGTIGWRRANRTADDFGPVEQLIIDFLHGRPVRLAEVIAIEIAGQLLLVSEVWLTFGALGFLPSWMSSIVVEGGTKVVTIAFAFIPGQVGVSEGAYALLAVAIGLPAAAGLSLALVRRVRGLLVAGACLAAVTLAGGDRRRRFTGPTRDDRRRDGTRPRRPEHHDRSESGN